MEISNGTARKLTRQGVTDLNLLRPPLRPCDGKAGCTASKWHKKKTFPNAAFDDMDTIVEVEIRQCLSCGREISRRDCQS